MFGSDAATISYKEMNDIMKTFKPLKKSDLLIRGVNKADKN